MTSVSVAAADTRRRRVGPALRRATGDFYRHSWRLAILNTVFSVGAIAVGFACSVSIFADKLAHGAIIGDLFAVLAAMCFAGNVVIVRAKPDTPAVPALVIAGVIAAATGLCFGKVLAVPGRDVALLMASGGIQQAAGLLLYLWAAKFLSPAETGILAFVETIFAPVWDRTAPSRWC